MHYLTVFVSTRYQKLSNLFVRHSARLTEKGERNMWEVISRTLTSNMILVKLKVAINADASVQHV